MGLPRSILLVLLGEYAQSFDVSDALAAHKEHKQHQKGHEEAFGRQQGQTGSLEDSGGGGGGGSGDELVQQFAGLELVSLGATAKADVRGNLGPASVVVQSPPGTDWIKDRWQAASDMHGTAIAGQHWVELQLRAMSGVERVRLDWEAAYCDEYVVQVAENTRSEWVTLFDGRKASDQKLRTTTKRGRSPGVEQETPLHVVHDLDLRGVGKRSKTAGPGKMALPVRVVRVVMYKSAMGWGVSLWQFSVWGRCIDVANKCDADADAGRFLREDVAAAAAWRTAKWLAAKEYCDGYNTDAFKAAAAQVSPGHDVGQGALARFVYPLLDEFSLGVTRIRGMLKRWHEFCEGNGLHYILYAGSLIGAMRHGGVIPWDTDADVQIPTDEFPKLSALADSGELKKVVECDLQKGRSSFACVGIGFKLDIWPVYELDKYDEAKPPEVGGTPMNERDLNKPLVSQKYWKDDNIDPAELRTAVLRKFDGFEARVPAKAEFYLKRLYGKSVLTTAKIWNDDFNLQHCNECDWSPNAFMVPFKAFDAVYQHYVEDQKSAKYGCRH
eukprot:g1258.t1